jgi:hypothetical protein
MSLVLLFVSLRSSSIILLSCSSLSLSQQVFQCFCLEMQLTKSEIMTQYFVGLHKNVMYLGFSSVAESVEVHVLQLPL